VSETAPTLIGRLRALPQPAWALFAGTFVNRFGSFLMPFLILYLTRRGFSRAQAALAVSCYGGGHLCASFAGGLATDRIGRRNTIVLSMFSSALMMLALSQAERYSVILLLSFLNGLAAELYRPASSALIADLVPEAGRLTAYSVYRLAINAGFAFGPATAGFFAEKSFFWLFMADAATSVVYGLLAWRMLPHGLVQRKNAANWGSVWPILKKDTAFLCYLAATLAISFNYFQPGSTLALHIKDHGFSSSTYGLLISLNGFLIIFLELPLTTVTQRWPARRTMAVGFALLGLGYFLMQWSSTVRSIALCVCVLTFGEMISAPVSSAFAANLAPVDLRGRYMGLVSMVWSLGLIVSPALGISAYEFSPSLAWTLCGLLGSAAAGLILIEPRLVRPEASGSR